MRHLPLLLLALTLAACGGARPEPPPPAPVRTVAAEPDILPVYDLAPTFAENPGRLPWPVEGTVVGFFGRRTDPETKTFTDAVGLDISAAPGAPVRAAFGGRVSRVGRMAAFGTYVMLKHGGFTTVYGNLSGVRVAQREVVVPGQMLGASGTREERRGARLFFAVFQDSTALDPLLWLRPRPLPPASPSDTLRAVPLLADTTLTPTTQ